jgi:hypothetical protein
MYKYILAILCLMASFCYGIASQANFAQNKFEFNKLYAANQYSTMEYGEYKPENAILYCKNIQVGGIWSNDPGLPSPFPTSVDCEEVAHASSDFSAQIHYA